MTLLTDANKVRVVCCIDFATALYGRRMDVREMNNYLNDVLRFYGQERA